MIDSSRLDTIPESTNTLILGGGIAALSVAFHLADSEYCLLEMKGKLGGHACSHRENGVVWDEGPHVSFTENEYVRQMFAASVDNQLNEIEVQIRNRVDDQWVDHPIQSNLYQLSEPLRTQCFESIRNALSSEPVDKEHINYSDWINARFGAYFSTEFLEKYTKKFWTVSPSYMSTDWMGHRISTVNAQELTDGFLGKSSNAKHYIRKVRYPIDGGFESFLNGLIENCGNCYVNQEVVEVDLAKKTATTASGGTIRWERLVNTLPLPVFINLCKQTTSTIREVANVLCCTQVALVNAVAPSVSANPGHWVYIYDESMLSTRISFPGKLSESIVPRNHNAMQVEVYYSNFRPLREPIAEVAKKVISELVDLGLINARDQDKCLVSTQWIPWANILFTVDTQAALETLWTFLSLWGLSREDGDTAPVPRWDIAPREVEPGTIFMTGRYGYWKYYWTDDCVLRGKVLAERILRYERVLSRPVAP